MEGVAYLAAHRAAFRRGFHHPARSYCPSHAHAVGELVFHPRGEGSTRAVDGQQLPFAPGDAIWYPAGFYHDQMVTTAGEDHCLHVELAGRPPLFWSTWKHFSGLSADLAAEFMALSRLSVPVDAAAVLAVDLRVTAALARLAALSGRPAPRGAGEALADRARTLVRNDCATIGSLGEVAKTLGCSHDRLRHVFRQRHGVSLVRWLVECRMERARDLLEHSTIPIREVATATGFASTHYFASAFRRETGTSPSAWRQGSRG